MKKQVVKLVICFFLLASIVVTSDASEARKPKRYLLYDCNPGEGFNLRRDVFIRIVNLVRQLRESKKCQQNDWVLVLPPWGRIGYHWKERNLEQSRIPWSKFFDVKSINNFVPVIEYEDYIEESGGAVIDDVWYLQRYSEGWTSGKFEEKMHERDCMDPQAYFMDNEKKLRGWFWGYEETYANHFKCVSIQGMSGILVSPLCGGNTTSRSVFLDRAENVLHETFGGVNYWRSRRSMVFSKALREAAENFREKNLDSTNAKDLTVLPEDWREHSCSGHTALGGPYIAAHVRRKDFLRARGQYVPSLKKVAETLKAKMREHKVARVFIASDGTEAEMKELKEMLPEMVMFVPTKSQKKKFKMGGLAIIDQLVCSHARYFIGTKESTFSFRIQEEREIMCFDKTTTFNRICGDTEPADCEQPTKWKIVWKSDRELWN